MPFKGVLIATFLELVKAGGSYAVVVTHTARSVLRRVDVRVDSIEARGLDADYNLVVDRTTNGAGLPGLRPS